jgi:16S rRNA (guanine527-N7)-methyltransferase
VARSDPLGGVSRETLDALKAYESELRRWSARINLVAPSTLGDAWTRHIVDSAQLVPLAGEWTSWVDLGSGAGLPGAIVAILARDDGRTVHLVESNGKKAAFLANVLADLAPNAKIHRCRIEEAFPRTGKADVVSARALAPLTQLLDLAWPWLEAGALALFPKGREYGEEILSARDAWEFSLLEESSVTEAAGRILQMRDVRKRVGART